MSPEEYLAGLERLVADVRDREALDFAARFQPTVDPPLSPEQLDYVGGMLEGAAMAAAMLDARTDVAAPVEVSPAEGTAPRG